MIPELAYCARVPAPLRLLLTSRPMPLTALRRFGNKRTILQAPFEVGDRNESPRCRSQRACLPPSKRYVPHGT